MAARSVRAFTLIELMIVVAIIGILAAIAIPNFMRFQLKSKTSEARLNLGAIYVVEHSYYTEAGAFSAVAQAPNPVPGAQKVPFVSAGFDHMGWSPVGGVLFSYAVSVTPDQSGFTAEAAGDIDGDAVMQYWAFKNVGAGGAVAAAPMGCNLAVVPDNELSACAPAHGVSIF